MYYYFLNIDYYSQIAIGDVMAEILLSIHLVAALLSYHLGTLYRNALVY